MPKQKIAINVFPSKKQWKSWYLPSKYTFISIWVALIGLFLAVIFFVLQSIFGATKSGQDEINDRLDVLQSGLQLKPEVKYGIMRWEAQDTLKWSVLIVNTGKMTAKDIQIKMEILKSSALQVFSNNVKMDIEKQEPKNKEFPLINVFLTIPSLSEKDAIAINISSDTKELVVIEEVLSKEKDIPVSLPRITSATFSGGKVIYDNSVFP